MLRWPVGECGKRMRGRFPHVVDLYIGRLSDGLAVPPGRAIKYGIPAGVGYGSNVDQDRFGLGIVGVRKQASPPRHYVHADGSRFALALTVPNVVSSMLIEMDMALPEGPRYSLAKHVVVGYRRSPRPTTRQCVGLDDILPTASCVIAFLDRPLHCANLGTFLRFPSEIPAPSFLDEIRPGSWPASGSLSRELPRASPVRVWPRRPLSPSG